ncbi:MAG TPA: GlxA family transcriptional regulator [Steroidobacteraceae bacterium]|nr:GlxA family transcriptional regulator [Steroidobacteraceae bacterium]
MGTLTIGLVGFERIQALDLVGPADTFQLANEALSADSPGYRTLVISAGGRSFLSQSGLKIAADASFDEAPELDTIIVPGGMSLRADQDIAGAVAAFLRRRANHTRRMVSVCTGVYAFGAAGLLDGRCATTHWRYAEDVARRFPEVRFDCDSLYIRDGSYYSSAGITAGIDLALALVEEDFGERVALRVARDLVVYLKRAGGQAQFSEPLQFQVRALDRFRDLSQWMLRHLDADLSVEALAEQVGLGTRHFSREFRATFGLPPAAYVERLRLDEARRRLLGPVRSLESVARAVGFASADGFRRAFERTFGLAPREFRRRFQLRSGP